jgi:transposase
MLSRTVDNEQIIERVAALDIGKAELMCCVRVPDEDHPGKRLQEVQAYSQGRLVKVRRRVSRGRRGWR